MVESASHIRRKHMTTNTYQVSKAVSVETNTSREEDELVC